VTGGNSFILKKKKEYKKGNSISWSGGGTWMNPPGSKVYEEVRGLIKKRRSEKRIRIGIRIPLCKAKSPGFQKGH